MTTDQDHIRRAIEQAEADFNWEYEARQVVRRANRRLIELIHNSMQENRLDDPSVSKWRRKNFADPAA